MRCVCARLGLIYLCLCVIIGAKCLFERQNKVDGDIIGMALPPDFRLDGCLPEGIHTATWLAFVNRFGYNPTRSRLLAQLLEACYLLEAGQCAELYVDGSFVTNKTNPGDIDICFDLFGLTEGAAFPLTWAAQQKQFPLLDIKPDTYGLHLNMFQIARDTGKRKGIVCLILSTLPSK